MAFAGAATYYYEVSKLLEQRSSIYTQNMRVHGRVTPGSVNQEGLILRFTITDVKTEASLPVVYQGIVPDALKAGNEVVVEGYLDSDGILQGQAILTEAASYSEVGELLEQRSLIYTQNVRVNGQVAPGSLEQESAGGILKFTLIDVDGAESLPVVYQGVVPDTFKVGNEAIVEGYLNSDGIFQGHTLVPKCASKYVPA